MAPSVRRARQIGLRPGIEAGHQASPVSGATGGAGALGGSGPKTKRPSRTPVTRIAVPSGAERASVSATAAHSPSSTRTRPYPLVKGVVKTTTRPTCARARRFNIG